MILTHCTVYYLYVLLYCKPSWNRLLSMYTVFYLCLKHGVYMFFVGPSDVQSLTINFFVSEYLQFFC